MTIDDGICWITWLACNLQTRNRFLMVVAKIKTDVINQLLLSRRLCLSKILNESFTHAQKLQSGVGWICKCCWENVVNWAKVSSYYHQWFWSYLCGGNICGRNFRGLYFCDLWPYPEKFVPKKYRKWYLIQKPLRFKKKKIVENWTPFIKIGSPKQCFRVTESQK